MTWVRARLRGSVRRGVGLGCVCLALAMGPAFAAKPNGPAVKIPLDELGFQVPLARALTGGRSMFTVNFVDNQHLLFTFHTREGLLARLPDATPGDDDRNVAAVLLELPSGKVLARTIWRTRDHERYLWPLTHGRFLLRVRTTLTVIEPMENLAAGDAFKQQSFVDMKRRIGLVDVSPGGDLISIETVPPVKPALTGGAASTVALAATEVDAKGRVTVRPVEEYTLRFYRLLVDKKAGQPDRVLAQLAGALRSDRFVRVAVTSEGYLSTEKESAGVYLFDFVSHTGKKLELSPYDTTCAPRPYFTSRSEFVAFGCHGAADHEELSGFNLHGEEPWVQVLNGQSMVSHVLTAPEAGRFALSRTVTALGTADIENALPEQIGPQEVTVLQQYDGRTLLKVQTTPIQVAGQNFDLSPDGLALAAVQDKTIGVYRLALLSGKDEKALKAAAAMAPEKNEARIMLNGVPIAQTAEAAVEPKTDVQAAAAAPAAAVPAARVIENGDAPPEGSERRKAPTLYDPEHPKGK